MTYLQKTFSSDEHVLVSAHLHWINYARPVFFIILSMAVLYAWAKLGQQYPTFNVPFSLFALIFSVAAITDILKIKKTEIICTNKRCIIKRGIFAVRTQELKNNRIESIEIFQPLWGRILDYGTLKFSGTGITAIFFAGISQPRETKAEIEDIFVH